MYLSILPYGFTGAGKSSFGVSSFYDWKTGKQLRRGKWVTFGREDNPALYVPEDMRVRLTSPMQDSLKFADDFESFCKQVYRENKAAIKAGKPVPVEALCIDGLSEFDLMFEQIAREQTSDKFKVWNDLLGKFYAMVQMLDPEELQCHVIVTARVQERKHGIKDKESGRMLGDDPDFVTNYYPSVRGQMRFHLPHYFSMVLYLDRVTGTVEIDGRKEKANLHRINMVPADEFLVKNQWEYQWLKEKKPKELLNASFDDMLTIIESFKR